MEKTPVPTMRSISDRSILTRPIQSGRYMPFNTLVCRTIPGSGLGIAFHGEDTSTYDAVYFRPFNFNTTDPVRKIHAVQYVSMPDNPWFRLRNSLSWRRHQYLRCGLFQTVQF